MFYTRTYFLQDSVPRSSPFMMFQHPAICQRCYGNVPPWLCFMLSLVILLSSQGILRRLVCSLPIFTLKAKNKIPLDFLLGNCVNLVRFIMQWLWGCWRCGMLRSTNQNHVFQSHRKKTRNNQVKLTFDEMFRMYCMYVYAFESIIALDFLNQCLCSSFVDWIHDLHVELQEHRIYSLNLIQLKL